MSFEYTCSKLNDLNFVTLKGDLIEKGQALQLLNEIDLFIEKKENKFILNLSELRYMNSTGLNVLINILTKSRKSGGDVAIYGLLPKIKELLEITKLNSIFNIASSKEEASKKIN
jgi:anti-sigma B factor antagonist